MDNYDLSLVTKTLLLTVSKARVPQTEEKTLRVDWGQLAIASPGLPAPLSRLSLSVQVGPSGFLTLVLVYCGMGKQCWNFTSGQYTALWGG